ncbi:ubiquitin domain-containing protein ubfd1 [Anaeramoeba ignava]|uniref:Ubiquitin domain-containing protein ubfd1 n=1 Tax=Anaeramoeba ignava TaxID=1746090 RepID=A0A9Q0L8V5_ANAIG|nr:ubiquitin domain-containing protein ubfd1 [Anaeramoeba ignava]|eukprot:Anaeramoba_ignava/a616214_25.p1 GENE.a616214_25~~a616214_25.p1  ORF type:complete len:240 (-),score=81.18 a616214_25:38-736(-)
MTEELTFDLRYKKNDFSLTLKKDTTIEELQKKVEEITKVPKNNQKLFFKSKYLKEPKKTLETVGIKNKAKILLMGSTFVEIAQALTSKPIEKEEPVENDDDSNQESFIEKEIHQKILQKGLPQNAEVGVSNKSYPLPQNSIKNILDSNGQKVQLIFKFDQDQIWVGSYSSTKKISINSIQSVISQKIPGQEGYSVLGFKMNRSGNSVIWFYFVPSQYIRSIKNAVMGDWQQI